MSVHLCLLDGTFHRDDDVAQHISAGFIVVIIDAVFSQREGKNIGRGVFVAELIVELLNLLVVHKADADLCRTLKILHGQYGAATASDQQADAGRNFNCLLFIRN